MISDLKYVYVLDGYSFSLFTDSYVSDKVKYLVIFIFLFFVISSPVNRRINIVTATLTTVLPWKPS